jgi:hypothetical protein
LTLPKFAHLAFKLSYPCPLGNRLAGSFAAVALDLLDLLDQNAKAVWRTNQFNHDRRRGRSFATIFVAVFHDRPHRAFAKLG